MSIFHRKPKLPPTAAPAAHESARPAPTAAVITRVSPPAPDWRTRSAYVPAAPRTIDTPTIHIANPNTDVSAQITPAATIESRTLGGHQDRARAWIKYAMPLCTGVAGSMVIAAVTLANVPLLSFSALMIFGLTFIVTYAWLLRDYWRHTPEGVALDHTANLWTYLRTEQAHRHAIERQAWQEQRRLTSRREEPRR